jgi:hypothetical protein
MLPPVSDRSAFSGECPAAGRVLQFLNQSAKKASGCEISDGGRRPLHCARRRQGRTLRRRRERAPFKER